MSILYNIAKKIKGNGCELLVKRTSTEITFSGASVGLQDIKIDTGSFSNKLIELVRASEVAVSIDNSQYLLCKEIHSMNEDDPLKTDYKKIRLQLMLAFNQLQGILGTLKEQPTDDLKKELTRWVKYMNDLHENAILYIQPGPKLVPKGSKSKLKRVMKYQGIDEQEMQDALKQM